MANPTDVLMQLQTKLDTKYMVKNVEIKDDLDEDVIEEDIGNQASGSAATGSGFGSSLANKRYQPGDQEVDVDNAEAADEPYVTNRGISLPTDDTTKYKPSKLSIELNDVLGEQAASPESGMTVADPDPNKNDEGEATGDTPPAGEEMAPAPVGGEMPTDPGMEDGMGVGEEDPLAAKTPSELGRIYELKKIYTRLTTIESYLAESSDPELLRIRLLVSKSIELFEILSSNIPVYKPPKAPKGRLDEIIVVYYKFLKQVYESVAKYYKGKQGPLKGDGLKKTTIKFTDKELI